MNDKGKRRPQPEDVEPVLEIIADGKSLRAACQELGIHPGHMDALLDGDDAYRAHYVRAKERRAEVLAEQGLSIGLSAANPKSGIRPDGARVALDAIKWATARMAPKTAPVERHSHSFESLSDAELDARLRALETATRADGTDAPAED